MSWFDFFSYGWKCQASLIKRIYVFWLAFAVIPGLARPGFLFGLGICGKLKELGINQLVSSEVRLRLAPKTDFTRPKKQL
jgi:hypothetical protein